MSARGEEARADGIRPAPTAEDSEDSSRKPRTPLPFWKRIRGDGTTYWLPYTKSSLRNNDGAASTLASVKNQASRKSSLAGETQGTFLTQRWPEPD